MNLTRLQTPAGPRWAVDDLREGDRLSGDRLSGARFLPSSFSLNLLLDLPAHLQADLLRAVATDHPAEGRPLAPVETQQEVWASGVTFLRSREAREAESATGDIYQRVYTAERPELFFKAAGWRVVGPGAPVRVRGDSRWNVPEPELVLLLNRAGEICGYTAGNDVSSRDIEGENPLYLPQAKVYNGSCALGPAVVLAADPAELAGLPIGLEIERAGQVVFRGETSTAQMKRAFSDLAACLFRELDFPSGAFLMTGTGIVPPESFSLAPGDQVRVTVGELVLENPVE